MTTVRLNDIEVCTSFLTQRSFRAAYCEFLVNVTARNRSLALKAYRKKESAYSGLRVTGVADLSFLADSESNRLRSFP